MKVNKAVIPAAGFGTRFLPVTKAQPNGFLHLLDSPVQEPVNIGNPDERSIIELAEIIIELTDSESDITFEPLPPQDPQVRRPDISKAKKEVGWEPKVDLREGLKQSIDYVRDQLESDVSGAV